jgi:hypothetical protein
MPISFLALIVTALQASTPVQSKQPVRNDPRQRIMEIVTRIQRADYEGDRTALKRLQGELAPFTENQRFASRVQYWRGFAWWRRAMNGFNEPADPKELEQDLTQAIPAFDDAIARDAALVDAKVGKASCLAMLAFLNFRAQRAGSLEQLMQSIELANEAAGAAPDNPRALWVQGANQWNNPPERGGGQNMGLATYLRGLALARQQRGRVTDGLEPSWGEPELLMSLAYVSLNGNVPDVRAAERYAEDALTLVPYWRYVRDILMPQIRNAKENHRGATVTEISLVGKVAVVRPS